MATREPGARQVLTSREAQPPVHGRRASNPAATITPGLDVLVQLVMAAITTEPRRAGGRGPGRGPFGAVAPRPCRPGRCPFFLLAGDLALGGDTFRPCRWKLSKKNSVDLRERDAILGPAGARNARRDRFQVELQALGERGRIGGIAGCRRGPGPGVALDDGPVRGAAAGPAR